MTAFTCTKHNEYCPEGVCRWCEPLPAENGYTTPPVSQMIGRWLDVNGVPAGPLTTTTLTWHPY